MGCTYLYSSPGLLTKLCLHKCLHEAAQPRAMYCLHFRRSNDLSVELCEVTQRFLVVCHIISYLSLSLFSWFTHSLSPKGMGEYRENASDSWDIPWNITRKGCLTSMYTTNSDCCLHDELPDIRSEACGTGLTRQNRQHKGLPYVGNKSFATCHLTSENISLTGSPLHVARNCLTWSIYWPFIYLNFFSKETTFSGFSIMCIKMCFEETAQKNLSIMPWYTSQWVH